MNRPSKFAGLAGALKEKSGKGADAPGRKPAKSQDKASYAQTTVYLHRDVHTPLQSALAAEQLEYSQLVEDLLRAWLQKKRPKV